MSIVLPNHALYRVIVIVFISQTQNDDVVICVLTVCEFFVLLINFKILAKNNNKPLTIGTVSILSFEVLMVSLRRTKIARL